MAASASIAPPPAPVTSPTREEDTLKFSFVATSIAREVSGDVAPSESSPVGPIAQTTSAGETSSRIRSSTGSLL